MKTSMLKPKPDVSGVSSSFVRWFSVLKWCLLLGLMLGVGVISIVKFFGGASATTEREEKKIENAKESIGTIGHAESSEELTTAAVKADREAASIRLDPSQDGWETEVVAEQAKAQLLQLCDWLTRGDSTEVQTADVSEDVTINHLRPAKLAEVFNQQTVVRRFSGTEVDKDSAVHRGHRGLRQAIIELAKPLSGASEVRIDVKVVRVSLTGLSVTTTARFEATGRTSTSSLQQRANFHCKWKRASSDKLQLVSLRASDYEEVEVTGPWLVESTKAVLSRNRSYQEQLAFGQHYWLNRLDRAHGIGVFTRSGIALGDVNGDGLDDVYLAQPGGLPNRLFLQQPDGRATDSSHESGLDWLDHTSSALIIDLDNDNDQDMIVATTAGLLAMENNGLGKFKLRATLATGDTDIQSISAVDYDHDGDLDLYVCLDFVTRPQEGVKFVYHDANDGAANVLFRNDIQTGEKWAFTNATKLAGLDTDNRRHSLACAWEDYDNDGDQDLYVANDYGQNCLYRNDGGRFTNIALQAGVVDSASGMSVSWGDYNGDGWMDLYVANMFSSAGNRITRQAQFQQGVAPETRSLYSRFARGNTLLQNDGTGQFRDVGASAGVEMGRWAWSSVFADMNNDSWDDLLVANGYLTAADSGDL